MNTEENKQDNKSAEKPDMFENNPDTFSEGEQMNRDYLVSLYNEDMSFLNKEIRMTRSGYIKMYSDIESSYQNRKKETIKQLIPMVVMYVIAIAVGVKGIPCPYGFVDVWKSEEGCGLYRRNIFGLFESDIPLNKHDSYNLCCENDKNIKAI